MVDLGKVKTGLAEQPKALTITQLIEKSSKELGKALPEHMRPERLVRIALTCIRLNPDLTKCTPESFMGALFVSAQMGVEPVAGRAYILPFNNNRKVGNQWIQTKEAQFIMGYKGLADLFYRHEKAVQLAWGIVHANDEFDYEYGTNARLFHRPAKENRGAAIGYYVIAELHGNAKPFQYMTFDDCMGHGKKHSKTFDKEKQAFYSSSPWATNPDSMCLKTVLIQLAKLLPLSVELQRAIAADETSREYRAGIGDALDLPDTTNWNEEPVAQLPAPEPAKTEQPKAEEQKQTAKEAPAAAWKMPANMVKVIDGIRKRIGEERFMGALGACGYETLEQVPTLKEANALLAEISKQSEEPEGAANVSE